MILKKVSSIVDMRRSIRQAEIAMEYGRTERHQWAHDRNSLTQRNHPQQSGHSRLPKTTVTCDDGSKFHIGYDYYQARDDRDRHDDHEKAYVGKKWQVRSDDTYKAPNTTQYCEFSNVAH